MASTKYTGVKVLIGSMVASKCFDIQLSSVRAPEHLEATFDPINTLTPALYKPRWRSLKDILSLYAKGYFLFLVSSYPKFTPLFGLNTLHI